MKKYVQSDSNFFDVVELGPVVGNVNSPEQLETLNKIKAELHKYKLSNRVVHWKIDDKIGNNDVYVYFSSTHTGPEEYEAVFNSDGTCRDVFIHQNAAGELTGLFLKLGEKLLNQLYGD